jgi:hypothetical protein
MKLAYFRPLAIFLLMASAGAVVFWPRSTLGPIHVVGFGVLLLSVALTYLRGIRRVLRDRVPPAIERSSKRQR